MAQVDFSPRRCRGEKYRLDAPERREAFADGWGAAGEDAPHADVSRGGAVRLEIVHQDALRRREP